MFRKPLAMNAVAKSHKSFAWSYSRLKNYETCPRRYLGIDVNKEFKQDETEQLNEGDRLHKAMAKRVQNDTPLPNEFYYMEKHAIALTAQTHEHQSINCELKLAINKEHKPAGFFDKDVWARCMIDYIKFVRKDDKPEQFAHIVDYKTGKLVEDDAQLVVNAMLVFDCFSNVVGIKSEFLWTKYSDTTSKIFTRKSIMEHWSQITPRVDKLALAHANNDFPPTPCKLCREWCAIDTCEYYGVGK